MEASTAYRIAAGGLVLLFVAVGLSMGMTGSAVAQSGELVDVDAADLAGSGTAADPYAITNASELQAMEDDLDAHYKLGNDINASGTAGWNNQKGFVPINRFNGTLNGTGNVISGLTIDRPSESGGGLINILEENGEIVKLHLTNLNLTGDFNTGGLIGGSNDGVIKNSSVDGTITSTGNDIGGLVAFNNGTVTGSTFSGEVTGAFGVGGIAGNNEIKGTIRNSSSAGEVTASNNNVGGIAGANGGLIRNSAATPAVQGDLTDGFNAGGLVGVNGKTDTDGTIESSYATGNVDGDSYVGGLVGQNFNGSIKNSYAAGRVSGDFAGGLVGRNDGTVIGSYWDTDATGQAASAGSATGLSTAQMTGSAAQDSMSALDFDTVWNAQSGDYPILVHQTDDTTDESSSVQVQLSNINLTPQTVDSGSESTHRLTFETQNVSADGKEDDFDITFPDNVELVSYSDVEIDEKSSGVDMTANTLEFSVDPTGGGSTHILGELNVTVSATN